MSDTKEKVLAFIGTSITELAAADTPFFKQVKAIFNVVTAGKKLLIGVHLNDPYENFVEILKCELKELAKSPQTDDDQMMKLTGRLKELILQEQYPLSIYNNIDDFEIELRKGVDIPRESTLPHRIAELIKNNIGKLVKPEEWNRVIYDKVSDLDSKVDKLSVLSEESVHKIEKFIPEMERFIAKMKEKLDEVKEEIADRIDEAQEDIEDRVSEAQEDIEERIDEVQGGIEERIDYQSSFLRFLTESSLPKSFSQEINKKSRFHYLNDKIGFHGRVKEQQQLTEFLSCDREIAVWGISGKGGVGKSKLARHICDLNLTTFKTVWLNEESFRVLEDVTHGFNSDKTILYVCDYADEKIEQVKQLISKMNEHKVKSRFLLLVREKETYEGWITDDVISDYHYNPTESGSAMTPLNLSDVLLEETAYKEIIEDYRRAYYTNKKMTSEDFDNIMKRAGAILSSNSDDKRACRCLFVLLIADAHLNNSADKCIDENALITNYFLRTQNHIGSNHKYKEIIKQGFRLVAFATMSNGLILNPDDPTLPVCVKTDIQEINKTLCNDQKDISDFLNRVSDGSYNRFENKLHPYEPDIIGEFLFLRQYLEHLIASHKTQWREYIVSRIARSDTSIMAFVTRCLADWKELGDLFQTDISSVE